MVCPTCFCTTTEDVTDLTGDHAERWRRWESCFDLDFSHLQAGPVRDSARSRYRQWATHKLGTWYDQFGSSGCVGCGRCIVWCPVGIDITEEAHALNLERDAARQEAQGGPAMTVVRPRVSRRSVARPPRAAGRRSPTMSPSPAAPASSTRTVSPTGSGSSVPGSSPSTFTSRAGGTAVVETLGEGELLGWSWLFEPYRWHLGAQARSAVSAYEFDAQRVRAACEEDPAFGLALTHCVARGDRTAAEGHPHPPARPVRARRTPAES